MSRAFVGRKRELEILEESYGEPSAFLMYGRRRIGKSRLLKEFCKGKRHLYVECEKGTLAANLRLFAEAMSELTGRAHGPYREWYEAQKDLAAIMAEEATVAVIDEYQYLADVADGVSSEIKLLVDNELEDTASMLILCGSSVRRMKEEAVDGRSPLFGRFKNIIRLGELGFDDTRELHPGMSDLDRLKLYLTFGGVPRYHVEMKWDTYEECIANGFIRNEWMMEETRILIESEYPRGGREFSAIRAVAEGCVSAGAITTFTGMDRTTCADTVQRLVEYGVLGAYKPMMGAPSRPVYYIADGLFAFYYQVLSKAGDLMDPDDPEKTMDAIDDRIRTFLGLRFELFCRDLVRKAYRTEEVGRWWIDDNKNDIHEEIDVVAKLVHGRTRADLYAECKFSVNPIGFHVYNELSRKVNSLKRKANEKLMLFSVSGFDSKLEDYAENGEVYLVGPDEIFGGKPMPDVWARRRPSQGRRLMYCRSDDPRMEADFVTVVKGRVCAVEVKSGNSRSCGSHPESSGLYGYIVTGRSSRSWALRARRAGRSPSQSWTRA